MDPLFEWDPDKAASNRRKHGIPFEKAVRAFGDPFANFEWDRLVDGEDRWHVTGMVDETLLILVVYTLRGNEDDENGDEVKRIISARRANGSERRRYNDNLRSVFGGFT